MSIAIDFLNKEFADNLKQKMNERTVVELTKGGSKLSGTIPFNSVTASPKSIIFRQVNPGNLEFMTLTFELFRNGNAKIIVPLEFIPYNSEIDSPAWKKLMVSLEKEQGYLSRIIDGFRVLSAFSLLMQKYFDFLKSRNWQDKFLAAYRIENTWRTILFLDSDAFIAHITKYGVPVCQRENAWIPSPLQKTAMIEEMPEDGVFQLVEFTRIASHFGILTHEGSAFIKEWLDSFQKKQ
jgi:hypothetical protein